MLKGKVALVTGSTSGIGLGIAQELAHNGCDIILNGFGDKDEIESIRQEIEENNAIQACFIEADLSTGEGAKDLIKQSIDRFGRVDILVNNAGIQHVASIEDFPDDKWDAIIAINLSAAFHTIKHSVSGMKQSGYGRIINIASAHGLVASANKVAYVAAKHGILGLTKTIGLETAQEENLTCNAICPGWVLTPLVQKQVGDWAVRDNISSDEAANLLLSQKQPSKQFTTPEQIGAMVAYLCSDAAKNVTGTELSIDGGWTAQ